MKWMGGLKVEILHYDCYDIARVVLTRSGELDVIDDFTKQTLMTAPRFEMARNSLHIFLATKESNQLWNV